MSIFSNTDSSPSSTFSPDFSKDNKTGPDRELEEFIMIEKERANFHAQVHEFNDFCWDKCLPDKPGSKLDRKTENCLNNCVDRFIDVSLLIASRFAKSLDKSAKV